MDIIMNQLFMPGAHAAIRPFVFFSYGVLIAAAAGCSDGSGEGEAECGNGIVEAGELCDGNCPVACDDDLACTTDTLAGADCSRQCLFTPVAACLGGDGCCPAACDIDGDSDCPAGCGDAVCQAGETCAGCPEDCGACPTCSDGIQNQGETGIDCGGPCEACPPPVADYYVAPTGDDDAAGTFEAPFATWEKLSDVMQAGDLAYIRGGTYRNTKPLPFDDWSPVCRFSNLDGTESEPIRIWAYPGEHPVLDMSDIPETSVSTGMIGVFVSSSAHVWFRGLRVTGLQQNHDGNHDVSTGWATYEASNITIENCEVDHIGGYGFTNGTDSNNNLYRNCDVHHCADEFSTGYEFGGANGFGQTGNTGSTNTTYSGCRAWWNSDDGFDFFDDDGFITVENSWAFWNGYIPDTFDAGGDGQGFKMGPNHTDMPTTFLRVMTNCLAVQNLAMGFDQNDANCLFHVYNNTAYDNETGGFFFPYHEGIEHIFRNNVSYGNGGSDVNSGRTGWTDDHNTWNGGVTASDEDFAGLDASVLTAPRQEDGSLPDIDLLHLAAGSDLIDAGVDVGLPYSGAAPDLGAFESE